MDKGFFSSLFDFSFRSFITTRIIQTLYVLAAFVFGLLSLGMFFGGVSQGGGRAVLFLILAPLSFLLGMMYVRVLLEIAVVLFRIETHAARIAGSAPASSLDGPSTSQPDRPLA